MELDLTPKQRLFVAEYTRENLPAIAEGRSTRANATQAAIRAGYSRASAAQLGYQLLQIPSVLEAIEKAEKARLKRLQASADKILAEWTNLGFSDPGALLWKPGELDSQGHATITGKVKPLHEMPLEVRRTIKSIKFDNHGRPEFSFWDKAPFHANLGKFHKLLTERVEFKDTSSLAERMRLGWLRVCTAKTAP